MRMDSRLRGNDGALLLSSTRKRIQTPLQMDSRLRPE